MVAPIVTLLIEKTIAAGNFVFASKERRRAIVGAWSGMAEQPNLPPGEKSPFPVGFSFNLRWKFISGTAWYDQPIPAKTVHFKGGFYDNQYLRIDFTHNKVDVIHFGTILLKLSADAGSLTGNFVAYGSKSEKITHGSISLKKP